MKRNKILGLMALAAICSIQVSCVDLDLTPNTSIPPELYFESDSQLEAYANSLYQSGSNVNTSVFSVHTTYSYGNFGLDSNSEDMMTKGANNWWTKDQYKVGASGGEWSFTDIYKCNYFFKYVLPKKEAGKITGSATSINQYIGEVYFFRAWAYFQKLQTLGDFPIVTDILPNDITILTERSQREPRNEVARFILSDLDQAISLMNDNVRNTRISKRAAYLLKSRVALFEGTWLKYFKGTAFVPLGQDWPGFTKDYSKNYQYKSGSIDAEISFFLTEAMAAAKVAADATTLVANNGILQQKSADAKNAYLNMFGQVDLSSLNEVVLWKQYNSSVGNVHSIPVSAQFGGYTNGYTKNLVNSFLMANGKPIYVADSGYKGDLDLNDVVDGRDNRLYLFMKIPGQLSYFLADPPQYSNKDPEPYPDITTTSSEKMYSTGYTPRKGVNFDDRTQYTGNASSTTGCIIFRGVEAYLNYMEACVEKNGSLDATGQAYWAAVRSRGNAKAATYADIQTNTIDNTDMSKEALTDFGAYSAGSVLSNKVLYNIRRERRMEFIAEGLRMMDLRRWRALDQLVNAPYHFEGFHLWGPMKDQYKNSQGASILVYGPTNANVSAPASAGGSDWLRPAEINQAGVMYKQGGHVWKLGHYLTPIAENHFMITSPDGETAADSPIYQNPYWEPKANTIASK